MGQRFQVYLIARVRPHGAPPLSLGRYRCVGALHHQWCYGTLPLRAVRRFVTLISQKENAEVVRYELRAIDGMYGSHLGELPKIPAIPCPFTLSILRSSWSTELAEANPEDSYFSSAFPLKASMRCWGDTSNDDGLSVIDITDPENPGYIFMQYPAVLQDAQHYLEVYYKPLDEQTDPAGKKFLTDVIDALKGVPLVTANQLLDAWPDLALERSSNTPGEPPEGQSETSAPTVTTPPSSLVDISLGVAVQHAVRSEEAIGRFNLLDWLPGQASQLKAALRTMKPFPDRGVPLLERALCELRETETVDLSGFHISGEQVVHLLAAIGGDAHRLNLSSNDCLEVSDIVKIASAMPNLRRLVLMECPSIVDADLCQAVIMHSSCFKSLEGILHPAFLTMSHDAWTRSPVGFIFRCASRNVPRSVWVPFLTPVQVVQTITEVIPWNLDPESDGQSENKLAFTVSASIASGARHPEQAWRSRAVVTVPRISNVDDAPWHVPVNGAHMEVWSFYCAWAPMGSRIKNGWGFVHHTRQPEAAPKSPSLVLPPEENPRAEPASGAGAPQPRQAEAFTGKVYDLAGYLDCMAREGRPMPTPAAVSTLQRVLSMVDPETGELFCPLMEDALIPRVGWAIRI